MSIQTQAQWSAMCDECSIMIYLSRATGPDPGHAGTALRYLGWFVGGEYVVCPHCRSLVPELE